jgi:hypothetical protein
MSSRLVFTDRPREVSVTWMYNREIVDWRRAAWA